MTGELHHGRPGGSATFGIFVLLEFLMAALLCAPFSQAQTKVDKKKFEFPRQIPAPANNRGTPARVELGKMLFFDPRLSGSRWISCATCHNPAMGWSDGLPTAIGNGMTTLKRATPTILNSAFNDLQMWDGRFRSLEEQAAGPMQAPGEMNGTLEDIIPKLESKPGYVQAFARAYPGEGVTPATLAKALASFERTIISQGAPFDAWVHGKKTAISPSAQGASTSLPERPIVLRATRVPTLPMRGFTILDSPVMIWAASPKCPSRFPKERSRQQLCVTSH